jgi:hypothetical protein
MSHPNWTFLKTVKHSEHRIMQVQHDWYRFERTGAERDRVAGTQGVFGIPT